MKLTDRVILRVAPPDRERFERAAAVEGKGLSEFLRDCATLRAAELERHRK